MTQGSIAGQRQVISAFLVCGGLAAFINWAARIILSHWMSFDIAVVAAAFIGMAAGFVLYKSFVWRQRRTSLLRQLVGFISVNAVSAVIVLLVAAGGLRLLLVFTDHTAIAEALAHGFAIAVGAVANYLGHGRITFA